MILKLKPLLIAFFCTSCIGPFINACGSNDAMLTCGHCDVCTEMEKEAKEKIPSKEVVIRCPHVEKQGGVTLTINNNPIQSPTATTTTTANPVNKTVNKVSPRNYSKNVSKSCVAKYKFVGNKATKEIWCDPVPPKTETPKEPGKPETPKPEAPKEKKCEVKGTVVEQKQCQTQRVIVFEDDICGESIEALEIPSK